MCVCVCVCVCGAVRVLCALPLLGDLQDAPALKLQHVGLTSYMTPPSLTLCNANAPLPPSPAISSHQTYFVLGPTRTSLYDMQIKRVNLIGTWAKYGS